PAVSHELELLATGLFLSSDEFSVTVLGADQPQEEIAYVGNTLQPAALVLFAGKPLSDANLRYTRRMAGKLECPVALAGPGSLASEARLKGTAIACLGTTGRSMRQRLAPFLAGTLDT